MIIDMQCRKFIKFLLKKTYIESRIYFIHLYLILFFQISILPFIFHFKVLIFCLQISALFLSMHLLMYYSVFGLPINIEKAIQRYNSSQIID